MGVCTFAWVPGSVQTFSNMPSLTLYHQNGKGHLTHGAKVSRGSLSITVCLECVIIRGWLGCILSLCCAMSFYRCVNNSPIIPICSCRVFPVGWLDRESGASLWGFSGNTASFRHGCRCRQWFAALLSLPKRFILPNVIFKVPLLWHLEKEQAQRPTKDLHESLVITYKPTFDNIPRSPKITTITENN